MNIIKQQYSVHQDFSNTLLEKVLLLPPIIIIDNKRISPFFDEINITECQGSENAKNWDVLTDGVLNNTEGDNNELTQLVCHNLNNRKLYSESKTRVDPYLQQKMGLQSSIKKDWVSAMIQFAWSI